MKRMFQAISLAILAVVLFCRPAHAQASCELDYACVSYLDFDSYNDEVYGYSYTDDTYFDGSTVSVETNFGSDDDKWYHAEVDVDQSFVNGTIYLYASHYDSFDEYELGETSAEASGYFSAPSGESTDFDGWDGADGESTIGLWKQTLSGSQNYTNLTVQETVGGTGADTCYAHYPNNVYAPFTAITGGSWPVDDSSQWGDDHVGWFEETVNFYREMGAVPCGNTVYQQMQILSGAGWVNYGSVNTLIGYIDYFTVSSERSGSTETKDY